MVNLLNGQKMSDIVKSNKAVIIETSVSIARVEKVQYNFSQEETSSLLVMVATFAGVCPHNQEPELNSVLHYLCKELHKKIGAKMIMSKTLKSLKVPEAWALSRAASCFSPRDIYEETLINKIISITHQQLS